MVSARLIQIAVVLVSAATAAAAPPLKFSVGPRIPSYSKHVEVIKARSLNEVDPSYVVQTECLDPEADIVSQDENIAQLSICSSLAGSIQKCEGSPKQTEGKHRSARFTVSAVDEFATVNISKQRWIRCVQAAREVCPKGSLTARCLGGASTGDVAFTLENPTTGELR